MGDVLWRVFYMLNSQGVYCSVQIRHFSFQTVNTMGIKMCKERPGEYLLRTVQIHDILTKSEYYLV